MITYGETVSMYAPQGLPAVCFFCLSVLCHSHSCDVGSAAAVRLSGAWPPPSYPGRHTRNAPCINCQVCARGVFRSQSARPFFSVVLSGRKIPRFSPQGQKQGKTELFTVADLRKNAGKSMVFRDSDRQTGIYTSIIKT